MQRKAGKKIKKYLLSFVLVIMLLVVAVIGFFNTKQSIKNTEKIAKTSSVKKVDDLPKGVKTTDWDLVLVNKKHSYQTELNFTKGTVDSKQIDQRIAQALANFRSAAQKAGYATTLVSGYRSIAYQTTVYNNSISQYESNGMSATEAKRLTESVIQVPGSSEHQTGQAVDLAGNDALAAYPSLEASMDKFKSQQWLIKHAPEYGFILRYPSDSQSIKETGIDYESWHFRYVGVPNATYITNHHLTLEKYIQTLKKAGR